MRQTGGPAFDLDASGFMLKADGRVRMPQDMIFYNNKQSVDGSVYHHGDNLTGYEFCLFLKIVSSFLYIIFLYFFLYIFLFFLFFFSYDLYILYLFLYYLFILIYLVLVRAMTRLFRLTSHECHQKSKKSCSHVPFMKVFNLNMPK